MSIVQSGVVAACMLTFITQLLTNFGLKRLIESIRNLTVLIHVFLIDVYSVAHAEFFIQKLFALTQFEFYDMQQYIIDYLHAEESDSLNIHFEAAGYETSSFQLNLGNALIICIAILFIGVLLYLF